MKEVTMHEPEQSDKEIANLLLYLDGIDEDYKKSVRMVLAGGAYLNPIQFGMWLLAVAKGVEIYQGYTEQEIPIGGIILNQETADGMKQNWQYIADKLAEYIRTFQEKKDVD